MASFLFLFCPPGRSRARTQRRRHLRARNYGGRGLASGERPTPGSLKQGQHGRRTRGGAWACADRRAGGGAVASQSAPARPRDLALCDSERGTRSSAENGRNYLRREGGGDGLSYWAGLEGALTPPRLELLRAVPRGEPLTDRDGYCACASQLPSQRTAYPELLKRGCGEHRPSSPPHHQHLKRRVRLLPCIRHLGDGVVWV